MPNRDFLTWQVRLLTLFAKIKFSRMFPNLHYSTSLHIIFHHVANTMNPDQAAMNPYSLQYRARIFLLVDLREFLFRFRVVGTKKKK